MPNQNSRNWYIHRKNVRTALAGLCNSPTIQLVQYIKLQLKISLFQKQCQMHQSMWIKNYHHLKDDLHINKLQNNPFNYTKPNKTKPMQSRKQRNRHNHDSATYKDKKENTNSMCVQTVVFGTLKHYTLFLMEWNESLYKLMWSSQWSQDLQSISVAFASVYTYEHSKWQIAFHFSVSTLTQKNQKR